MKIAMFQRPVVFAALVCSLIAGSAVYRMSAEAATAPAAPVRPAGTAAQPAAGPPVPRIIVIDRNAILRASAAGKSMMNQAQGLSRSADTEFKNQAEALQKEATALQQQLAILAPDVRAQKQKEFTTKQEAFQKRVTDRQAQIQNGFAAAGQKLDQALGPILQTIMRERGANMMLDRSAVILSSIDVDVTATAIERLDKAMPTLAVSLARTAPAGAPAQPAAR